MYKPTVPCSRLSHRPAVGFTRMATLAAVLLIVTAPASAAPSATPQPTETSSPGFILFSASSLSYLYGFNWQTPFSPSRFRDVLTVEHYNANRFGDLYFFADAANLTTSQRGTPAAGFNFYGELGLRLSLNKMTGSQTRIPFFGQFFPYAGAIELGHSGTLQNINESFDAGLETGHFVHIHGISFEMHIPGFQVASLSGYWRDNTKLAGSTWQASAVWALPFRLGKQQFLFNGFADLSGPEGGDEVNFHSSPQLVYHAPWGSKSRALQLGVEVDLWFNEFGIKGKHDYVPQLLIKAQF